jgi:hypothetical protein
VNFDANERGSGGGGKMRREGERGKEREGSMVRVMGDALMEVALAAPVRRRLLASITSAKNVS